MTEKSVAKQFERVDIVNPEPVKGFAMWTAVWVSRDREMVIGAPTIAALEARWRELTGCALDRGRAQHVAMIGYERPQDMDERHTPARRGAE